MIVKENIQYRKRGRGEREKISRDEDAKGLLVLRCIHFSRLIPRCIHFGRELSHVYVAKFVTCEGASGVLGAAG